MEINRKIAEYFASSVLFFPFISVLPLLHSLTPKQPPEK